MIRDAIGNNSRCLQWYIAMRLINYNRNCAYEKMVNQTLTDMSFARFVGGSKTCVNVELIFQRVLLNEEDLATAIARPSYFTSYYTKILVRRLAARSWAGHELLNSGLSKVYL